MHHLLLYIDPGSGSYLVQAIVAAALGVAFFLKILLPTSSIGITAYSRKIKYPDVIRHQASVLLS